MITTTLRPESPTSSPGNGMQILHAAPTDMNGQPFDGSVPSLVTIATAVVGQYGATQVTPRKLTRAGIVAVLAAVNTYIAGLTAAQQDQINTQLPGGLVAVVTPTLVQVPVAPAGASGLATTLAGLLIAANLTVVPA